MAKKTYDDRDEFESRDRKRDRNGWKAQRTRERRAKNQRREFETRASTVSTKESS